MKIYRAIRTNKVSQRFGENVEWYKSFNIGLNNGHNGWDFSAAIGEPIYWDCDIKGMVLNTEMDSRGGLGVNVISEDGTQIFKHRFWHLQRFACIAGQVLESGDLIGYADNTGLSTRSHLHRDIKPMYSVNGKYEVMFPQNGWLGCVDLEPYFTNTFILDLMENLKTQVSIITQMIEIIKKILSLKIG